MIRSICGVSNIWNLVNEYQNKVPAFVTFCVW